jgi:dipeptidyl aminopeptidase/acylaminoacyl peptidase
VPDRFAYPTRDGHTCHGLYYPPVPARHRPPLIIRAHPGPTANAAERLDPAVQFFTRNGFAVADIDYRGSTGYGRHYRDQLRLRWGVLDPHDCADAARHLAATGRADPARTVITGASAGGYTALRALLESATPFAAATATSAVIDPAAWRQAVPRFQAHHTDSLIGPWPEAAGTYRQRSVLHHASRIHHPVLLIHGTADPITPAYHAEQLAAVLHRSGRPCTLLLLPGEGHTLKASASITAALHAELDHYQHAFEARSAGD